MIVAPIEHSKSAGRAGPLAGRVPMAIGSGRSGAAGIRSADHHLARAASSLALLIGPIGARRGQRAESACGGAEQCRAAQLARARQPATQQVPMAIDRPAPMIDRAGVARRASGTLRWPRDSRRVAGARLSAAIARPRWQSELVRSELAYHLRRAQLGSWRRPTWPTYRARWPCAELAEPYRRSICSGSPPVGRRLARARGERREATGDRRAPSAEQRGRFLSLLTDLMESQ